MDDLKYIGYFYKGEENLQNRIHHMSSVNKMLYVSETLVELGEPVEIISPSWTKSRENYPGYVSSINDNIRMVLGPTIAFTPYLSQLFSLLWLFFYLLFKTKSKETILVYHSLPLIPVIKMLKIIKKLNVILEVEEIYSHVIEKKKNYYNYELSFIKSMNHKIYVSSKLAKLIKYDKERDIILYGGYTNRRIEGIQKKPETLVYAGTIDHLKGGAFGAIDVIENIKSEKYSLYILGTGTDFEVSLLEEKIRKVNKKKRYDAVKYLGKKEGKEFDLIMNSFEYGLNLQKNGEYMETAFPSKILTYLSYGLVVISSDIPSIVESPFTDHIEFVDGKNSREIAHQVLNIIKSKINNKSSERIIIKFHDDFKKKLKNIIN